MRSDSTVISFFRRHRIVLVSLFLALFSLHLALTDRKSVERGSVVRAVLSVITTPLQNSIIGAYDAVAGTWGNYIYLVGLKAENDDLREEVLRLAEENNRLKEEVHLNDRLKEILGYRDNTGFNTMAAAIQAFNIERWTRTIVLNKGSSDGIGRDMAVICPEGVVGRVIDTTGHTSRVLLTTDLRSDIDVILQRTRIKGVVEGNGTDGLTLKYIRELDNVELGDLVVTSGFSGIFPKGLVLGTVTDIEKGRDNFFKNIKLKPSVDVQTLEDVLVVAGSGTSE